MTVADDKKNDKATAEKKQDSMEVDGDAAEVEEGTKKKKKKGAKEEATKEKGNCVASPTHRSLDYFSNAAAISQQPRAPERRRLRLCRRR